MHVQNLGKHVATMADAIDTAVRHKIPAKNLTRRGAIAAQFKEQRAQYFVNRYKSALNNCKQILKDLEEQQKNSLGTDQINQCQTLLKDIETLCSKGNFADAQSMVQTLVQLVPKPKKQKSLTPFDIPALPTPITEEVRADLNELFQCYENGCYRSSIILCGRILEAALHRKYYEYTKNDLLETAPGIGLGKIIAKMSSADIPLPVGLNEQIHLINNVRIVSVHKKKRLFNPSKDQTHAIILYTLDTLRSIFGNTTL